MLLKRSKKAARRGFSYIEVLVSLSIVAICVVSLLGLYVNQLRAASRAANIRAATAIATDKLSELAGSLETAAETDRGKVKINNTEFTWQTAIEEPVLPDIRTAVQDKLTQIKVTVKWQNADRMQLTTLVRREGAL